MHYRREVDGLRAVAVIPVIFFHAGFELFQGGYVGVDVFFVISGYLITALILKEKEEGRFSLLEFYERRVRRIIPALFLVMMCCIPFAVLWMAPAQLKAFSQSVLAMSLFASNILFWRESGYFDTAAEEKPLLHTWSLAVEEQYYLFFPLFIMLFWFLGRGGLARLTAAVAFISLLLAEYGWRYEPDANFYLLPTRAWELFVGALCAFYSFGKAPRNSEPLALLGLAGILLAIFFYSEATPFPSVYALAPVLGAALIILYGGQATVVGRLLSTPLPVAIGLISYSAYLWHQPLFAFARIRSPGDPGVSLMLALSGASLLLATLSWRYVEIPFRRRIPGQSPGQSTGQSAGQSAGESSEHSPRRWPGRWRPLSRPAIFTAALSCGTVLAAAGYYGGSSDGFTPISMRLLGEDERARYQMAQNAVASHRELAVAGECRLIDAAISREYLSAIESCYQRHGPATVILGDSHAEDIYHALGLTTQQPFLVGLAQVGCQPYTPNTECPYQDFADFLRHNPDRVDRVIYKQSGSFLVADARGNPVNMDLYRQRDLPVQTTHDDNVHQVLSYLKEIAAYTEVVWLGPRLEPQIDIWNIVRSDCEWESGSLKPAMVETFLKLDRHLQALVSSPGAAVDGGSLAARLSYVSEIDLVNFDVKEDFWDCEAVYWRDGDHWSVFGEKRFGQRIASILADTR